MQDIFLSYSSKDRNRLVPLVQALEAEGWSVFWDHRTIKVAQDWHEVIGTAIQECPCVIVAWSKDSVLSPWVKEEALIARDRGVLYPITIDQVALPFGFNLIQAADFTQWDGKADHQEFVELREQLSLRLNLRRVVKPAEQTAEPLVTEVSEPVVQTLLDKPEPEKRTLPITKADNGNFGVKLVGGLVALAAVSGAAYWYSQQPDVPEIAEVPVVETVKAEAEQPVVEEVKAPDVKTYAISMKVEPGGAVVTIDGKPYQAGQRFEAGTYQVRATAEGYVSTEGTVEINDSDREVTMILERKRLEFEPEMVKIPGGTFTLGCLEERDVVEGLSKCPDDEKPAHKVTVSDFALAKTEVTVGQYQACIDAGVCPEPEWREKGSDYNVKTGSDDHYKKLGEALTGEDYPIVGVSWDNAKTYVGWLSEQTGQNYRLPTEAEWEFAARAGMKAAFSWGNSIGSGNANCWKELCGDSFGFTSPVAGFPANPFGLHDMHGNVWEWVSDWYGAYGDKAATDPKGPDSGGNRVLRGGSWYNSPRPLRSAYRSSYTPDYRDYNIGFRTAQGLD